MSHKNAVAGKALERTVACELGAPRFWANSGESVDNADAIFVYQCKHVKTLSLNALHDLLLTAEEDGRQRGKRGAVVTKPRRGAGRPTRVMVTVTIETFRELLGLT